MDISAENADTDGKFRRKSLQLLNEVKPLFLVSASGVVVVQIV
jgi:hypothetical protein